MARSPKENEFLNGESLESARVRLRRPRNDPLGQLSGRGVCCCDAAAARRTRSLHHGFTVSHMLSVSRRHTANVGGLRRGKMLAETHLQPMQLA